MSQVTWLSSNFLQYDVPCKTRALPLTAQQLWTSSRLYTCQNGGTPQHITNLTVTKYNTRWWISILIMWLFTALCADFVWLDSLQKVGCITNNSKNDSFWWQNLQYINHIRVCVCRIYTGHGFKSPVIAIFLLCMWRNIMTIIHRSVLGMTQL